MARTLQVWVVLLIVITTYCAPSHEVQFYQGCSNTTLSGKQFDNVDQSQLPFSCITLCINQSYSLAAVQNASICLCTQILNSSINSQILNSSTNSTCGMRCPGNNNFPCGDVHRKSVYSTALPVVLATSLTFNSKAVPINKVLALEITVLTRRPEDMVEDLQSIQGMTLNHSYITWKINDKPWDYSIHELAGNTTIISKNISFNKTGIHRVCVTAKNLVSKISNCTTVEVLLPISRLRLVDIAAEKIIRGKNSIFIKAKTIFYMKIAIENGLKSDFNISFGHGLAPIHISTRDSMSNPRDATCITVSYTYFYCGTYMVNVSVANAISSETLQPIQIHVQKRIKYVQVVVFGGHPGEPINITAIPMSGEKYCSLNFNWRLNNNTTVISTQVPYIEHVFNKTGKYDVFVTLYNNVSTRTEKLHVYIQTPLINATLSVKGHSRSLKCIFIKTRTNLIFQVNVMPYTTQLKHNWYFNDEMMTGNLRDHEKQFDKPGRYIAYVKTTNKAGSTVGSNKLEVIVENVIGQVDLHHKGVIVINQNISFSATVTHGSNISFLWDFGDGVVLRTKQIEVAHNYKSVGLYNVIVMVYNHVSHSNASRSIYATKIPSCQPPNVKILGWRKIEIYRYEEVHLESQVQLNCVWADAVLIYQWKILPVSKEAIQPNNTSITTSEPVLIIPPYTLTCGSYKVVLKVHKNSTVLSSEQNIEIVVKRHGLIAVIKGGTMRVIGYDSKQAIILNGSDSRDPDFPEETKKLRFQWECHLLNDSTTSCFDPKRSRLPLNKSVLRFKTIQLLAGKDAILVTLTVSQEGMSNSSTWQILRMVNARPHLLTLRCVQCENGLVNSNDPLVLEGRCLTCPRTNENLKFEWSLYIITKDESKWKPEQCVPGKNIQQRTIPSPTLVKRTRRYVNYGTPKPLHRPTMRRFIVRTAAKVFSRRLARQVKYSTRPNTYGPPRTYSPTTRPSSQHTKIENGDTCYSNITMNPTVTPTNCTSVTRRPTYGHSAPTTNYWLCIYSGTPTPYRTPYPPGHGSAHTGRGSGAGSYSVPTSGNMPLTQPTTRPTSATTQAHVTETKETLPLPTEGSSESSSMYDPEYVIPASRRRFKLLGLPRMIFDMPVSWTNTGLTNRNLVLNDNILMNGKTFMLALQVKDDGTAREPRRGMANVFFEVNPNPSIGNCGVTPSSGFELETEFTVVCKDGSSKDKPLNYRITYTIQGDREHQEFLIYTGTNTQPSFVLPSGNQEHGYQVSLHVTVSNYKGSSVKVCPMVIRVEPTIIPNSKTTTEEYLYNKTKGSQMKDLIKVREEQKVKQLINVIARVMNRLNAVKKSSSRHFLRRETRTKLLEVINQLRIRDVLSAVESGQALETITRVKEELNLEELKIVSKLISDVKSHIVKDAASKPDGLSTNLVNLVTRLASNLMAASSYLFNSSSRSTISCKQIHLKGLQVVQDIIKAKLQYFILGVKPFKIIQPSLSAIASQSLLISQPVWTLQNVTFVLPDTLQEELRKKRRTYSSSCLGTTMMVFETNPYAWNETDELHHTKASSFVLSSCKGGPIPVRNLHSEIDITLPWTLSKFRVEAPKPKYTVKWQYLNIHHISTSNTMANQSLHLNIQTLSKLDYGFVFKVLVNTNREELDPDEAKIIKSTRGGSIDFRLTASDLANSSGGVRLGILLEDTALDRIKKVFSVRPVNYTIVSKWIGCFYWDDDKEAWSTRGCYSTKKTTGTIVNCRCNHLTTFIGKAFWAPNPLSVKDLRKISSISSNPIALALVLCLVALYIILLIFCHKLDKHDEQKGGAVYLASAPCRTPHRYKITVETGHWFGCGTTATVVVRLFGETNTSDPIELVAKDKTLFERGSRDVFIFNSPTDLSPLWKIHVWHYNQGESPKWYLNRITVKDMVSSDKWYFNSYRWLAVDEGDGKVDVELKTKGSKETIFLNQHYNIAKYLTDYHLWMSVIGRPSYSNFTRKQRLTCCLSLVLSFLCTNAAWSHTHIKTKPFQILGFLDLTWETVAYGVICGLVVVPLNLLWILIFRYSKPRKRTVQVYPGPYDEPVTDSSCLQHASDYIEDSVSILDQTIETLLYLKTLGSKIKRDSLYLNDKSSLESTFGNSDGSCFAYSSAVSAEMNSLGPTNASSSPPESVKNPEKSYSTWSKVSQQTSALTNMVRFIPNKKFMLPSSCVYIAWIGCFGTIIASAVITVWYGLRFGRQKSIAWFQSLSFSLLGSLLISQPIMALAIPIFMLCYRVITKTTSKVPPANEEDSRKGKNVTNCSSRKNLKNSLKATLDARRHQRYLKFLKPLTKNALSEFADKVHVRKVLADYFREFLTSLVLLVLVCILVNSMYCGCAFDIQNAVQSRILSRSLGSKKVEKVDLWWKTNQNRIIELLYWNPNERALQRNRTPEIFFKDTSSVLIGKPRIRQYKTANRQMCKEVDGTGNPTNKTRQCYSQCIMDEGHWSTIELSRIRSDAFAKLNLLNSTGWISLCTMHITIEFLLFAGSVDAYSAVTWEIGVPTSSIPHIQVRVNSMKDAFKDTSYEIFLKICKGIFVLVYAFCLHHEFFCLIRSTTKYFKNPWKYIEVFCLFLCSLSVILYINWSVALYNLVRDMLTEVDDNVFGAGELLYHRQELLILLYAMIIFVLVLKLIHLMRVFEFVQRFWCLLWTASGLMLTFVVFFLLVVTMFSHFGYLVFGSVHFDFKTFPSTFFRVSGLFRRQGTGHFVDEFSNDYQSIILLYLASYIAVLVIVLRGLSMSIFNSSVHGMRKKHLQTHIVFNYLSNLPRKFHRRKTVEEEADEEDEDLDEDEMDVNQIIPVEYACDEVEFQMEEVLFKMDNLVREGGLANLCMSSSSDPLLSSDEYDDDVEYLYRPGRDLEYLVYQALPDIESGYEPGSGYESDRSFYSLGSGSQSQEGLTDLEMKRRISKDSSDKTSADLNSFDPSYCYFATGNSALEMQQGDVDIPMQGFKASERFCCHDDAFSSTADILNMKSDAPIQGAMNPLPRRLSRVSNTDSIEQKAGCLGVQSSSVASIEKRRSSLTKTMGKSKHLHPLTRKPKLRRGEILLDEVPKDFTQAHSGREDSSTTSEESEQVKRKKTKKQIYLRTLGLLSKSSVAPIDCDGPLTGNRVKRTAFQADVSSGSTSHEQNIAIRTLNREPRMDEEHRQLYQAMSSLPPERHEDPSLCGVNAAPLPGLIGDIAMNSDISTNIDVPR